MDSIGQASLDLDSQISKLTKEYESAKTNRFSWNDLGVQTEKVLKIIAENDPQALKMAYHALFDAVIIGPENDEGIRTIMLFNFVSF